MLRSLLIVAFVSLLLVGCSASAPTSNITPASSSVSTSGSYPAPAAQGYPSTADAAAYPGVEEGPPFTLNQPIRASDPQVSGTGPAGVPIKIVDVTDGGTSLSQVTIGADGTFTANVQGQLKSGNRVAVQLDPTAGVQVDPNAFRYGPGYQDIPSIGLIFVSAQVE